MTQLVLWCAYFSLALLAQLNVFPALSNHQYFPTLMGGLVLITVLTTLLLPMKKVRKTAVLWLAFGFVLTLRVSLIFTWMWRTSTPIAEFHPFVVSWFGFDEPGNIVRYFVNPQNIPLHFESIRNVVENFNYFHSIENALATLSHHVNGLLVEVAIVAFPPLAIIGAIVRKSKQPKIEKPLPPIEVTAPDGRVIDENQLEKKRQEEERELQRKLEDMRRQNEQEQKDEAKRNEKQHQDEAQRQRFNELSNSALSGNAQSQHELALMYLTGLFPAGKDIGKAIGLLEEAGNQNNINSQIELGRHYSSSEHHELDELDKAMHWFEKAANEGDSEAQFLLGDLYYSAKSTDGSTPNYKQAAFWWGKASDSNHPEAMRKLSSLFQLDAGIIEANSSESFVPDPVQGAELIKRLAYKQNDPEAMLELGIMHFHGQNVEKDEPKGVELIEKGLAQLGEDVPDLYLSGVGLSLTVWGGQEANYDRVKAGVGYLEKLFSKHPQRVAMFNEEYLNIVKEILALGKKTLSDMDAFIAQQKEEAERQRKEAERQQRIAELKEELYWAIENVKSSQQYLETRKNQILYEEGGNMLTVARDYYYTGGQETLNNRFRELNEVNAKLKALGVDTGI